MYCLILLYTFEGAVANEAVSMITYHGALHETVTAGSDH